MKHWTEIKTALTISRLGTVKAAAEALALHRATVMRHVDTLERDIGSPLFQRHASGYALTESGQDLVTVASRADEMFADLAGRAANREGRVSGELRVTSMAGVAPLVMPVLDAYAQAHPDIQLEFIPSDRLAKLEQGEAHVAFRAGNKPGTQDYVVKLFKRIRFGLYASERYIERRGMPDPTYLTGHAFVGSMEPTSPLPYSSWLKANVPAEKLILRTASQQVTVDAVSEGIGLGFVAEHDAERLGNVKAVLEPQDNWAISLWIVTHVDLRRTLKVQSFLQCARRMTS